MTAGPKEALRDAFVGAAPDAVLADPVTKAPLSKAVQVLGGVRQEVLSAPGGGRFASKELYADLLPSSSSTSPLTVADLGNELREAWDSRVQTQLFRSPFISFLYERGWRQQFAAAGFPGIDQEFKEVQAYFAPVAGGVVVDLSCGSGLMTRRLVTSGDYARVLALDYSESMLTETARRVKEESVPLDRLQLVRADVAALPLQPGTVDAIHAGAAMHCWPQLDEGLKEIRAALKPGKGRFFATTFLQGAYGNPVPETGGNAFRFFTEPELTELLVKAGFPPAGIEVRREGAGCAVIKADLAAEA